MSHEEVVSPTFLMEVFNKFFSKTFEKDPKFPQFQKEWENFREILNKDPLDLDQVFTHIAKVQLNLGKLFPFFRKSYLYRTRK